MTEKLPNGLQGDPDGEAVLNSEGQKVATWVPSVGFTHFAKACLLISRIQASLMEHKFRFRIERDSRNPETGRAFVQCVYDAPCTVTGELKEWRGRKWYLSDYMTEDEVVKTCYAAFKAAVEHEVMEGFTFEGKRVFNPHTPFRVLMEASQVETFRVPPPPSPQL